MEFLYEYGLFLAKAVTVILTVLVITIIVAGLAVNKVKPKKGQLHFTDLSEQYSDLTTDLKQELLDKKTFKKWQKAQKEADEQQKKKLYIIDFKGGIEAKEAESLREEVTAVLIAASEQDEVLVRLESGGGVVHGYGLAASQLDRIKQKGIPLTIAVDKIAASGGYMMACIGNKILAAPFAIIGSIGVVAQLPNFNKLLKKNHIDYEQFTAGEYKRTVTLFGENTDKGREKFQNELEETHLLFKEFVKTHRPQLDIDKVATGEHWFGYQALPLQLIDHIQTSDDYVLQHFTDHHVYQVKYDLKKGLAEKFGAGSATMLTDLWQRLQQQSWFR